MPISSARAEELAALCRRFRVDVLTAIHGIQSGHPGGSLSVCEILTLLMQERMRFDGGELERDRLVLSKGHAAPMLYRNLVERGILPADSMGTLRRIDSLLQGHPSIHTPGVDMPAGPLGLGLSAAQGMALALRMQGSKARVWAVLGDGELDEGCIWEAAMSAPKFGLSNLCAIVDWNGVQLDGTNDEVMPLRAGVRRPRSARAGRGHGRRRGFHRRPERDPRPHGQGQGRLLYGGQGRLARQGHRRRELRQSNAGAGR